VIEWRSPDGMQFAWRGREDATGRVEAGVHPLILVVSIRARVEHLPVVAVIDMNLEWINADDWPFNLSYLSALHSLK